MACDCLMNCFYSSLPCLLVWLSCMWFFSFCDDHQFIDVTRCERFSRSTWERWLRCLAAWVGSRLVNFLLGPWPMYWLSFQILLLLNICIWFSLASLRALDNCMELYLNSETALRYYFSVTLPLIMFRYKYTFGTLTFSESSMWYPNFRNVQFGTPIF